MTALPLNMAYLTRSLAFPVSQPTYLCKTRSQLHASTYTCTQGHFATREMYGLHMPHFVRMPQCVLLLLPFVPPVGVGPERIDGVAERISGIARIEGECIIVFFDLISSLSAC